MKKMKPAMKKLAKKMGLAVGANKPKGKSVLDSIRAGGGSPAKGQLGSFMSSAPSAARMQAKVMPAKALPQGALRMASGSYGSMSVPRSALPGKLAQRKAIKAISKRTGIKKSQFAKPVSRAKQQRRYAAGKG